MDLDGTQYDEKDNWVARYSGVADVVQLGIDVVKVHYVVAAAGPNVTPITTPPVFDRLLEHELKDIAALLAGGKRGRTSIRKEAKRLFTAFRGVPMLDRALRSVAKLGKDATVNPSPAVARAAGGFISSEAAAAIGIAIRHILDKVSPPNSRAAWTVVTLFPATASFVYAAESFAAFSPANPWQAVLPACVAVASAGFAMLAVSPVGWLLSAAVSSVMRLRVPAEYRQRGRNWTPLKSACLFAMSASFIGALYGAASAMHWVPNMREVTTPVWVYATGHAPLRDASGDFMAEKARSKPVTASAGVMATASANREVQRFLIAHGYLHGPADGNLGPRTVDAIARYKRQEGLSQSIQMSELLARIRAAVPAAPATTHHLQAGAPLVAAQPTSQASELTQSAPRQVSLNRIDTVAASVATNASIPISCRDDGTFFGNNICKSQVLADSYQRELREYGAAQRRLGGVDNGVRIEQERWLQTVTRDCADEQCLTSAFAKRSADLSGRYRGG
ncbi:peptidoglycan-binding domain-containing protein [Paraburkholderia caribensis]|uniref:peptidoglycan-binding domain-containing protein n=1 Tax=Paraburkholderia caribensis TaxID=75105 RepID=UPI001CC7CA00|nr:peptidoglycan-binding domain-containing protein [Paraburkholderia caribensis]